MFHGIILRSQLIELIKNKVFFDETAGVCECTIMIIPSYQYVSITGSSLLNSLSLSLRSGSPTLSSPQTILATPTYTRLLET